MVRLGLSIYLILVTLAGPMLCPCSMPQFFSLPTTQNADASPGIARACPCCPKPPTTSANIPRGDQQPGPVQTPCPCPTHSHHVIAVPAQRAQQAGAALSELLGRLQLDALFRWADCASLRLVTVASEALAAPVYLSSSGLLHVFCLLRC